MKGSTDCWYISIMHDDNMPYSCTIPTVVAKILRNIFLSQPCLPVFKPCRIIHISSYKSYFGDCECVVRLECAPGCGNMPFG